MERGNNYKLEDLAQSIYRNALDAVSATNPHPLSDEPEYKYLTIAARMLKDRGVDTKKVNCQVDEFDKRVGAGLRHDYSFEDLAPGQP
ncbi:hypothetical protein PsB1_0418 [Candidatus Phycosocius spiralis]|uniref:Uncharacterized protein n=1 Tax=Candidatus Phycosocius spiralis TaxID=2815099 RepID=A0ABQ4PTM9_9PROT|nr:hypothetical protein PsB1_0418 [Candidatus Phycosocius spiralis]